MANPVVFFNGYVAFTTSTASAVYVEVDANKSIEIPLSKAELANSVMGDSAETFYPGLISAPITVTHRQDFTTAGVDKKFWTLWNAGTPFRMKVRPVDAAASSSNPSLIFTPVRVFSITPISGAHGALLENAVTIKLGSGATVTRSTST
jgi:hypothetical protein